MSPVWPKPSHSTTCVSCLNRQSFACFAAACLSSCKRSPPQKLFCPQPQKGFTNGHCCRSQEKSKGCLCRALAPSVGQSRCGQMCWAGVSPCPGDKTGIYPPLAATPHLPQMKFATHQADAPELLTSAYLASLHSLLC